LKAAINIGNHFGKHQIIFTCDREGILLKLSPAWFSQTGFSISKSKGNPLADYIFKEDQNKFQSFLNQLNKQLGKSFNIRLINHRGKLLSYELNVLSVEKNYYTCLLYNITSYVESNKELAKSEEWFRLMYTHAPLSYHSLDENGYILAVNQTWSRTLGYTEKEVKGNWIGNYMTKSSIPILKKNFPLFKQRGHVDGITFTMVKKDGTPIDIELYGLIGYHQGGAFKQTHCAFRNITQERHAQLALARSEARFRELFETAMDGIYISDAKGHFTDANRTGLLMLQYERNELISLSINDVIPVEAHADQKKRMAEVLAGKALRFECLLMRKDEHVFPVEVSIRKLSDERIIMLVHDISKRKLQEQELKSDRDKLRKSEALLHAILDSPKGLIVFSLDRSYRYTAFTKSHKETMKQIWGLDIQVGMNILKAISNPDDRKKAKHNFDKTLEGEYLVMEEAYGDDTLSRNYYENYYSPIYDDKHKIIGLSVFVIDITDRKYAEQQIKDQNILLQKIAENYPNSYLSVIEKDFTIGFTAGKEFEKQGLNPNDYIGLSIEQVFGDYAPFIKEKYKKTFKGAEQIFELKFNGQYQLYRTVPLRLENGKINRILSVVENISERKESELAIKASETKFRSLFENSNDSIIIHNLQGNILDVNQKTEQIFGYNRAELLNMKIRDLHLAEDYPRGKRAFETVKKDGHVFFEISFRKKNHEVFLAEVSSSLFILNGKKVIQGQIRDITDRKMAEEALKASEAFSTSLLNTIHFGIDIVDEHGNILFASEIMQQKFGKDIKGKKCWNVYKEDKSQCDACPLKSEIHLGATASIEVDNVIGSRVYEINHTGMIFNGRKAILETFQDISERKKAEQLLIQTTHDLLNSQRVARIGSYVFDISSGIWTSSEVLDAIFDIPENYIRDVSGWLSIIHPDDREIVKDYFMHEVLEKKQAFNKEYRIVKQQSGIIRWVHSLGEIYPDKQGNPLRIVGTVQDITDKKEQNLRLEASEKFLRSILNSEPECVKILDKGGKLLEINPAGLAMLEVESAKQVINKSIFDLLLPEYKSAFKEMLNKVLKGESQMLIFEIQGLKGTRRWLESHSVPYLDQHGNIIGLLGVTRDITERKILEIKNKEVLEEIRLSLQDKEVLLKELYHRTKNNMQVMVGLLSLQMQQIDNKEAIEILQEAKNRIFSMSMVHEHLQQSKNLSRINFKNYLISMINSIVSGYEHLAKDIRIEYDMQDIFVNINAAIPCALVVNEIITNAMKYAFPENQSGKIVVKLKSLKSGGFLLKIADNGVGMPETFDWQNTKSLGMWIITHLTKDQLKGNIKMNTMTGKGTSFTLKVPDSPILNRD